LTDAAMEAREHVQHAEHAAHANDPFISRVSITVALLAVLSASAASLEGFESASAIIAANQAVLAQDQASDQWNFFEAKSLKKNMYGLAAVSGGAKAADYAGRAKAEGAGQDQAQAEAKRLEAERDAKLKESAVHERRHHRLTIGATMLEVGIAIATIAIITRKRWPWLSSVALGCLGAAVALSAYVM
jgi:hypothetical protein